MNPPALHTRNIHLVVADLNDYDSLLLGHGEDVDAWYETLSVWSQENGAVIGVFLWDDDGWAWQGQVNPWVNP